SVWEPTIQEWAIGKAALALGIPYVAHVYSDITVRVHVQDQQGQENIGSGVVISKNIVLTNAHVVRGKENVCVSWDDSPPQAVQEVITHPNEEIIDIALLKVASLRLHLAPSCVRHNLESQLLFLLTRLYRELKSALCYGLSDTFQRIDTLLRVMARNRQFYLRLWAQGRAVDRSFRRMAIFSESLFRIL
ncbi:MAG TPA: serine protease, partial [Pyrinomonadaceae bacterium]|nr:serine protease [Pyrinomonadaceae bacterium]